MKQNKQTKWEKIASGFIYSIIYVHAVVFYIVAFMSFLFNDHNDVDSGDIAYASKSNDVRTVLHEKERKRQRQKWKSVKIIKNYILQAESQK